MTSHFDDVGKVKESLRRDTAYWKRLFNKIDGKPEPMQILQKRTMNTALAVLQNLEDVSTVQLFTSLYFYCQDIKMKEFTHRYEAVVEMAGANPDKFVFGLHKFYTDISHKIKKENLYSEFFEFYYRCVRLRQEQESQRIEDNVVLAYLNILTQNIEYLRPNKFDFSVMLAGQTTTGELMTVPDLYPNLDQPNYDLARHLAQKKEITSDSQIFQFYKKYGYEVNSMFDIEVYTNVDKLYTTTVTALFPLINEYTFDILPVTPFSAINIKFRPFIFTLDIPKTKLDLTKRNRTLPSNGVVIKFEENPLYKELLLKETFFDNKIFLLFRLITSEGDISGYYDTKDKFFYSVFNDIRNDPSYSEKLTSIVLYLYGCYVLNDPFYQIANLPKHFAFLSTGGLTAEGILHGGKLRNTYKSSDEHSLGTARKGNDKYEAESRTIQGFIRRVPEGKKPSGKAIALAESLGYSLAPNETYVQPFIKQVFKLKRKEESQ